MKRRDFVKCMGHSIAIPTVLGSFGFHHASSQALNTFMSLASDQGRILVLVYLQGGNDGLNTVIPLDQFSTLNTLRPDVILNEKQLLPLSKSALALHPALPGLRGLYETGKLCVLQNVGYPEQNYSHFRSTDIWQSGSAHDQVLTSGWLGRYLTSQHSQYPEAYPNESHPHPLAIEFGRSNSLVFQGTASTMSMVLNDPTSFYNLLNDVELPAPDTPAGDRLKFVRIIAKQSQQYGQVVKTAAEKAGTQMPYPDTDLAQQLKVVAQLIAGGLQTPIYKVTLKGFDTHSDQVDPNDHHIGTHRDLLSELDGAISAFMADLTNMGRADDVVGMTYSEFGRRIVSNGSLGTDHGSAAPILVFGNKVNGGVIGDSPSLDVAMSFKDNLEAQYDFRQVYASVMEQWFEAGTTDLASSMLDEFDTLPIIKQSSVLSSLKAKRTFTVYPNPLNGQATVEFQAKGMVRIELLDLTGRRLETIYHGEAERGANQIKWNTSHLAKGNYLVSITTPGAKSVQAVIK